MRFATRRAGPKAGLLAAFGLVWVAACLPFGLELDPGPNDLVRVTSVQVTPPPNLVRVCPAGVAMLSPFDKTAGAYREVARLKASGEWDGVDNGELYRWVAWKAARLGANAVIVDSLGGMGWKRQRVAWATAIDIPADSQRVRLACGTKKSRGPPHVGGQ